MARAAGCSRVSSHLGRWFIALALCYSITSSTADFWDDYADYSDDHFATQVDSQENPLQIGGFLEASEELEDDASDESSFSPSHLFRSLFPSSAMQKKAKKAAEKVKNSVEEARSLESQNLCNGQDICDRKFRDVTFPGTHNSHATSECSDYVDLCPWVDTGVKFATAGILNLNLNHEGGLVKQWNKGYRSFALDNYMHKGKMVFCHGPCGIGPRVDAVKWFKVLKKLMERNRKDVVVLSMESYTSAEKLETAFKDARLDKFINLRPNEHMYGSKMWNRELMDTKISDLVKTVKTDDGIERSKRLIVLPNKKARGDDPEYDTIFGLSMGTSQFAETDKDKFKDDEENCVNKNQPVNENMPYKMQHYMAVYGGLPSKDISYFVNSFETTVRKARFCWEKTGVRPTILSVDFYDVGDVVGAATSLNTMGPDPGTEDKIKKLPWGGWDDHTKCWAGSTCWRCTSSKAKFHWSLFSVACGVEKKKKGGCR